MVFGDIKWLPSWIVILVVSDLPDIIITWMGSSIPGWMFWVKTGFMTLDIPVALAGTAILWLMKHDHKVFFLIRGQIDAPIEPVRWLGIKPGESWKAFGWIFTGIAAICCKYAIHSNSYSKRKKQK